MRRLVPIALAFPLLALGCATSTKAKILEKSFADAERRHELFEANLEVLDRNPAYVDEFFAQARKHPATLDRFIENQSRALETDDPLAAMTAEHLRAHPKALQRTMINTLDAVERDGAGRRAVANAMRERAAIAADIVVEEHDALSALGKAMASKAAKDPAKRDDLRKAVKDAVSDSAKK
jgi:hypothetical protein